MSVQSPTGILTFPNATLRTSELQCNTLSMEEITFNVTRGFENVINTSNVSSKAVHISNTQAATSTTVGALRVDGGIACGGNLWCSNLVVQGVDVAVGALDLQQVMVAGNTTTRPMSITNTTASSNKTTGALTVAGGVGINGALNVLGVTCTGLSTTSELDAVHTFQNTTTPTTARILTTGGQVYFQSGTSFTSDSRANINFTSMYNGTNYLTIQGSTGHVGIGIANPSARLHVVGTTQDQFGQIATFKNSANSNRVSIIDEQTSPYIPPGVWGESGGGLVLGTQHTGIKFYASENGGTKTQRMFIKGNGLVGIGVDPSYPLHVYGGTGNMPSMKYFNSGSTTLQSGVNDAITLYVDNNIYATGLIAASDERIKKEIVDADDAECLETLRLLKPKKYQYKDEIGRGQEPVWGFIAQEVRNTLPYATQVSHEFIPNIYELANVSSPNVITFSNFNTANLEANSTTIRVMTHQDKSEKVSLVEVVDDHTIRVEEDLTDWVAGDQLFIYGQEVDDFVFLKKDAIWTVATAAIQEVDRQLQAEKAKVATLETQLEALQTRVDALENN